MKNNLIFSKITLPPPLLAYQGSRDRSDMLTGHLLIQYRDICEELALFGETMDEAEQADAIGLINAIAVCAAHCRASSREAIAAKLEISEWKWMIGNHYAITLAGDFRQKLFDSAMADLNDMGRDDGAITLERTKP